MLFKYVIRNFFFNKIKQGDFVMNKYLKVILIFFIVFFINFNIFAYEIEEEIDYIWLQEEIKYTSANPQDEISLGSRYVVAYDRDSKCVMYGKNENKQVPMASTTKIMTAIVLLENLGVNNNLTLESKVEVCKQAGAIGGSRLGLKAGDKITVNDLMYGLMLCSR